MDSATNPQAPQGAGVAYQAAPNYQQAPPQQQYQQQQVPQYYPQANLSQAPMAQPQAPQQQGWQTQASNQTAIARLEALLTQPSGYSQPTAYSQTSPLVYQPQAPQVAPMFHQQYQGYLPSGITGSQYPASQPTYGTTQQSSQGYSGVSPADLAIVGSIRSEAGLASLAEIPSAEIAPSKSVLNALAVDYEERIFRQAEMIQQMAPVVEQAHNLKALFTPEGFTALSELFLEQLATIPGAYDHFLANGFNDLSSVFVQPAQEHLAQKEALLQQQYQQQIAQQQAMPQQYQASNVPQTFWGDGQNPLDANGLRPQFPDMPNPTGRPVPQIDLEGTPPNMLWQQIDAISAKGGFRGTTFAADS